MAKKDHYLYSTWCNMRRRCTSEKDASYPRYGGRGITVCERWSDFWTFVSDMGPRPSPDLSIDRIDNNKGYSPDNCRWATVKEQVHNRRCARFVTIEGKRYRAIELAQINGRKLDTIMKRAAKGLPYEKVIQAGRNNNAKSADFAIKAAKARAEQQLNATHCINGHEWTPENTRHLPYTGNRRCITCLRAAEKRARIKRYATT